MYKPGEIVKASGIYETVGGRQAALSKGDRFPPTAAGAGWKEFLLAKSTAKATTRRRSTSASTSTSSETGARKGRRMKRGR